MLQVHTCNMLVHIPRSGYMSRTVRSDRTSGLNIGMVLVFVIAMACIFLKVMV